MLERLQHRVHLAKKAAQIAKQLQSVWAHFGKNGSLDEAQQPNQPPGSIRASNFREGFAIRIRQQARQGQLWRVLRKMHHGLALQIDERGLARRVHDLQDERASLPGSQMKVVVVLARKRSRPNVQAIDLPGQSSSFRFGYPVANARFEEHASKFIRNSATASTAGPKIAVGSGSEASKACTIRGRFRG